MMSPAMAVAMMVAMMLPSFAPTLWRHHRLLRATPVPYAGARTMIFAAGYASVWAAIGLAMSRSVPIHRPFAPEVVGAVILCAGALQCSPWKAAQLLRCRGRSAQPQNVMTAWLAGCTAGGACSLSCGAPMAVLFVTGLMDTRMMLVITAVVTAERVAPGGAHIARLAGVVALGAGFVMCARAAGMLS